MGWTESIAYINQDSTVRKNGSYLQHALSNSVEPSTEEGSEATDNLRLKIEPKYAKT